MRMPRVLTGIILAGGLAGTAQAEILASGQGDRILNSQ